MTVGITELPPEGMQLPGVALAGDADRGTKTTEGISLLFTTAGITVQGPQPQIERLLVWSALDSATCHEVVQLADAREAAIMELTSGGQSIRFLLPTDTVSPGQAAYLDQALPAWLGRYKGQMAGATAAASAYEGADIGVELPAPGPAAAAAAAPAPPPAPSYATAGVAAAGAVAGVTAADRLETSSPPANENGTRSLPVDGTAPDMSPSSRLAPPPAPSAPSAGSPPPPTPAPTFRPAAPQAPMTQTPPGGGSAFSAPTPAPTSAWEDPPLASTEPEAPAKTPWYKLAPRKPKATETAAAAGAAAALAPEAVQAAPATPVGAAPSAPVGTAAAAPGIEPTTTSDAPPADAKTPWYKLAPREPKSMAAPIATEALLSGHTPAPAPAPTAAAPAPAPPPAPFAAAPAPPAPPPATPAAAPPESVDTTAADAKTPWYKLAPSKSKAAGATAAATAPGTAFFGPTPTMAPPPPPAPPADPVPLAVQPPAPVSATGPTTTGPGDDLTGGPGGTPADGASSTGAASGVVLATAKKQPNRAAVIALVAALVLVLVGGAAYVLSKRNSASTSTAPAPASSAASAAADTALAGSINLRLADLPSGWTQAAPAQAVVRPPVAPAVAQADATNSMASCLNTSYSVVAGLFSAGSLPNQTSLVQSPTFQSAAGSTVEMGSKTMTLASPGQVQALDAVFTNPKFDACFQQYAGAVAAGAVPGATAAVQPVTLTGPTGVQAYGVVTTYTLPGAGTEVVGDAYMLGGRVVSILTPSTNGPAIPGDVFSPAFDAVAGRVAAAAGK